jgi:hypothetical protein
MVLARLHCQLQTPSPILERISGKEKYCNFKVEMNERVFRWMLNEDQARTPIHLFAFDLNSLDG